MWASMRSDQEGLAVVPFSLRFQLFIYWGHGTKEGDDHCSRETKFSHHLSSTLSNEPQHHVAGCVPHGNLMLLHRGTEPFVPPPRPPSPLSPEIYKPETQRSTNLTFSGYLSSSIFKMQLPKAVLVPSYGSPEPKLCADPVPPPPRIHSG